jgi:hypothetical protein
MRGSCGNRKGWMQTHWEVKAVGSSDWGGCGGWWSHPLWPGASSTTCGLLERLRALSSQWWLHLCKGSLLCGLLLGWTERSESTPSKSLDFCRFLPPTVWFTAGQGLRVLRLAARLETGSLSSLQLVQNSIFLYSLTYSGDTSGHLHTLMHKLGASGASRNLFSSQATKLMGSTSSSWCTKKGSFESEWRTCDNTLAQSSPWPTAPVGSLWTERSCNRLQLWPTTPTGGFQY